MFHSIISEYDVFFADADSDPAFPGYYGYGENSRSTSENVNADTVRKQSGFFSTDPKDYLKYSRIQIK